MLISVNPNDLPVLLSRHKRDFGITAAIIAAVAASAAAATAAAVALTTSVQTASTLNNLTTGVAEALATQELINGHLQAGIMIVNQRVDLIQEQVDILQKLLTTGCIQSLSGLCITSVGYNDLSIATNLSEELSRHLNGTWPNQYYNLTRLLRQQIFTINATKIDIAPLRDWVSVVNQTLSFAKEWAGMGALLIGLLLSLILMFRCFASLRKQQRRQQLALVQACMALEAGTFPQIWLAALDR
ncbi:uncharacterized protein LOC132006842 [Mustela nigripes]|uniref:uncharacterized protein LOC132006842 n=1 Tax=Mustela nigripes TaxID=77151 RepID=UPI0028168DFE|nr:uncharacterized protein LOC132006842 [Mustela nigripes]XP_059240887.1 uncharacterized protein LOC132006842 [Mustela nigripes]XP_059240889.1 uncharacterized protein LOC132006842 [Mustela nigripes]XP_059240890.1 uncharacterized protein LOC132006842 [Mustela nigripes]